MVDSNLPVLPRSTVRVVFLPDDFPEPQPQPEPQRCLLRTPGSWALFSLRA